MSNPKEEGVRAGVKTANLLLSTPSTATTTSNTTDKINALTGGGSNSKLTRSQPPLDAYEQVKDNRKSSALPADYCRGDELNNNTITQQDFHSMQTGKMDHNRKPAANSKPSSSPSEATTLTLGSTYESRDARSLEYPVATPASKDVPTYSSIFAPSNKQAANLHRSPSPQQIVAGKRTSLTSSRPPLVKQTEADSPVAEAINGLAASNKELAAFNYGSRGKLRQSEEDEPEDDDLDERLPFNSNLRRSQRLVKHGLPESHRCTSKQNCLAFDNHQCDLGHQHTKQSHTKISFNDGRPPSFGVCHTRAYTDVEASLDRRHLQSGCQKCDCNECFKNRKLVLLDSQHYHSSMDSSNIAQPSKYNRTKTLHLVLKSIVLILLTILLLIFLIAILVASHYLPQALERIMNTTRSFNVTIAG